jgi:hypothetical protein
MRIWEGKLYRRDEGVLVSITRGDGWIDITVEREVGEGYWHFGDVDDRSPADGTHDIWVVEFPDRSEVLVEYWYETDQLRVAYRDDWSATWQPPATLNERVSA